MKKYSMKNLLAFSLSAGLIFLPTFPASAAPQNGNVVAGSATIQHSSSTTTINQSSDRAIVNWKSFDIGKNEAVHHNMPSSKSAALHRVVGGGGASQIEGLLKSNGNIYLVNPAGTVIHNGATINTNSFTATTRDISNENFMKGNMVFDKPGRADASVINKGSISVNQSGLAALVAPTVRNDGVIAGKLAKVALASGDSTFKLDMHGDELITFTVDDKDVAALHAADGTPLSDKTSHNAGSIKTNGGIVVMTASQLDGIVSSVVNTGDIEAGNITFKGKGSEVAVKNTGTVNASSATGNGGLVRMDTDGKLSVSGKIAAKGAQKGGTVILTGKEVALQDKTDIDVSGTTQGGTALIGGNALGKGPERNASQTTVSTETTITADATDNGNGGQVVVWADDKTVFDGTIYARGGKNGGDGGKVETSAKDLKIGENTLINTLATQGKHGDWLLDPTDFYIAETGGDMTGATLSAMLELTNVTIESDDGSSGSGGDVFVYDPISWRNDTTLMLRAQRNINVNAAIKATGDLASLLMHTEKGGSTNVNAKITLSGTNPELYMGGRWYTVINTVEALQNVNFNLSGIYALGSDIDASDTVNWNAGKGFQPLGQTENVSEFKGIFDGLGHVISNLYINRPDEARVGLFGFTRKADIKNVGLENVKITGDAWVGGLIGQMYLGAVNTSYTTGTVTGRKYVGGLVGRLYGGGWSDTGDCSATNSYSACNIFAKDPTESDTNYFGGFAGVTDGWASIFKHSYSIGAVTHTGNAGGFYAAHSATNRPYTNCYFDSSTSGFSGTSSNGGRETWAMQMQSNFYQWDFDNIWTIDEGVAYPKLKIFTLPDRPFPPLVVDPSENGTPTHIGSNDDNVIVNFSNNTVDKTLWGETINKINHLQSIIEENNIDEKLVIGIQADKAIEEVIHIQFDPLVDKMASFEGILDVSNSNLLERHTTVTLNDLGIAALVKTSYALFDYAQSDDMMRALTKVIDAFNFDKKIMNSDAWKLAYGKSMLSIAFLDYSNYYIEQFHKYKFLYVVSTEKPRDSKELKQLLENMYLNLKYAYECNMIASSLINDISVTPAVLATSLLDIAVNMTIDTLKKDIVNKKFTLKNGDFESDWTSVDLISKDILNYSLAYQPFKHASGDFTEKLFNQVRSITVTEEAKNITKNEGFTSDNIYTLLINKTGIEEQANAFDEKFNDSFSKFGLNTSISNQDMYNSVLEYFRESVKENPSFLAKISI